MTSSNSGTSLANNIDQTIAAGVISVIDPTLPGTFIFFKRASFDGGAAFYSDQHTITVSCAASSTTITAPSILGLPLGETEFLIVEPDSTYTFLNMFSLSNSNCALNGIQLEQISGGSIGDI